MAQIETPVPELEGTHEHTLDAKGRISIPADFRGAIGLDEGSEVVLTRPLKEACLLVFWPAAWEDYKARIEELPMALRKRVRRVVRGSARRVKVDRLGRVQVPAELRKYAQLESKCFVMGQVHRVEIWSVPIWNEEHSPDNFADLDLDEYDI